jgi:hypothetical protein
MDGFKTEVTLKTSGLMRDGGYRKGSSRAIDRRLRLVAFFRHRSRPALPVLAPHHDVEGDPREAQARTAPRDITATEAL